MTGFEFSDGMFQDVGWLMRETEALYTRIVNKHGEAKALLPLTADRIVSTRNWEPAMPVIQANLHPVLDELKVFFVPKVMKPGPAIVFPQRDIAGNFTRARLKPLFDLNVQGSDVKYAALGVKQMWKGPNWFGNSIENSERLLKHKAVVLVEGPFDLLACRLLCPDLPVMSTGTKALSAKHLDYLQIMGVKRILLMWDNEMEKGKSGGNHAMATTTRRLEQDGRFSARTLLCPEHDPSTCLERYSTAFALRNSLRAMA